MLLHLLVVWIVARQFIVHLRWRWTPLTPAAAATAAGAASSAASMIGRDIPELSNPCKFGAQDDGVAVLCHLKGHHVHTIEMYVVLTLPDDLIVGQKWLATSLWVASAFLVKVNDLRGSPVVLVDGGHPGLVHAVHGVCVPHVGRGVHRDALGGCLFVWVKAFRCLPLDAKSLPPMIKQHHGSFKLRGHAAFVEHHVYHVLWPLWLGVDHVPLEGRGWEVACGLVNRALLLLLVGGGVNVDDVILHCLGFGLLGGSGRLT